MLGHEIDAGLGQLHVKLVQIRILYLLFAALLSRSALLQAGASLSIRGIFIDQRRGVQRKGLVNVLVQSGYDVLDKVIAKLLSRLQEPAGNDVVCQ